MTIDPTNLAATARISFREEFDNLDIWNGHSGRWATNFWWSPTYGPGSTLPNNGEQQWYINANYAPTASVRPWTVDDGVLSLTASRADPALSSHINGYKYTSGTLNSFHSFSQTYGYFEMSAKLPAGQGLWPAFWLLPASGVTPPPELDIVEVLGKDPGTVHTALHRIDKGVYADIGGEAHVGSTSDRFHTYGVDWSPTKITWYFDGRAIAQTPTSSDMHQPMYMIVNLALGGNWGGNVDASTPLPAKMEIDYIRVYADAGASGPAPQPGSGGSSDPGRATAGPDLFVVSQEARTLTGGDGADTFVFKALPWRASAITDFKAGVDKLDIAALYRGGYQGADPVRDGYLSFVDNGAGGTRVMLDVDGRVRDNPWPFELVNLDGVSPYSLTAANVLGGPAPAPTVPAPTTPPPTSPPPTSPTAPSPGAGPGPDVIMVLQSPRKLTGGEGADTFTVKALPWRASTITDFQVGTDKLDISALYRGSYQGRDPVADGYLSFQSTGSGGVRVMFDPDGRGGDNPWPFHLVNLEGVSPVGLTAAKLLGAAVATPQPQPAPLPQPSSGTAGAAIVSRFPGDRLNGGSGADTLTASRGEDVLTGGAGADRFSFPEAPWRAGTITDFTPGVDILDLRPLFAGSGVRTSDPVAEGYVQVSSDGAGGSKVYFDLDGPGWYGRMLLTTLQHVEPSTLVTTDGWVVTG